MSAVIRNAKEGEAYITKLRSRFDHGLLVIGVAGSGKSTFAQLAAKAAMKVYDTDNYGKTVQTKRTISDSHPDELKKILAAIPAWKVDYKSIDDDWDVLVGISDNLSDFAWDTDLIGIICLVPPIARWKKVLSSRIHEASKMGPLWSYLSKMSNKHAQAFIRNSNDTMLDSLDVDKGNVHFVTLDLEGVKETNNGRADDYRQQSESTADSKEKVTAAGEITVKGKTFTVIRKWDDPVQKEKLALKFIPLAFQQAVDKFKWNKLTKGDIGQFSINDVYKIEFVQALANLETGEVRIVAHLPKGHLVVKLFPASREGGDYTETLASPTLSTLKYWEGDFNSVKSDWKTVTPIKVDQPLKYLEPFKELVDSWGTPSN